MRKMKKMITFISATAILLGGANVAYPMQVEAADQNATAVELNYNTYLLKKNQSVKLKATKKVTWKSANPSVATVSSNGKVIAKKEGKAKITAVSKEGGRKKASCTIKVVKNITGIKNIKITSDSNSMVVGDSVKLKTRIKPAKVTLKKLQWESSDKKVATVNKKGVVKALSAGTVKITAKAQDGSRKKASIVLNVAVPATGIRFTEPQVNVRAGKTQKLSVEFTPADATERELSWSSSNASVVKVDENGNITALAEGTAAVTAVSNKNAALSASCNVTVLPAEESAAKHTASNYIYELDRSAAEYRKVYTEAGKESTSVIKASEVSGAMWKLSLAVRNGIKTEEAFYNLMNTACQQNAFAVLGASDLKVIAHASDYSSMTLQTAALKNVVLEEIRVTEPEKTVTDPNGLATKASRISFKVSGEELILEVYQNGSRIAIYRPNYSVAHFEFYRDNMNNKYIMRMTKFFNSVLMDKIDSFPNFNYLDMYNVY